MSRLLVLFLLAETFTWAQVAGPNGHFYKVVIEPNLLWEDARLRAAESTFNGVHGYLATITSAEEDQFIENLRREAAPGGYNSLFVGGSQLASATSPTDGWFWVNGEGPISMANDDPPYANWQTGEPNDYWGPQSERFLSVGHFNTFGWNDEPDDRHIHGYVVEYPDRGRAAVVSVTTTDPIAVEKANSEGPADFAVFQFTRDGDLSLDLPVFYSIHGTAQNAADYNEISRSIIIPAGQASVRLEIVPRPDALTVVEPMETVGIRIEASQILTPSAAYDISYENRDAAAVIYENRPPPSPAIQLAVPRNGFTYALGTPVGLIAAIYSTQPVNAVDFHTEAGKIGSGQLLPGASDGLSFYKFIWSSAPAGQHLMSARATISGREPLVSSASQITVRDDFDRSTVSIRFVEPATTEPWPDADFAPGYLEVTRVGSTGQNLQVHYSVGGTATADADYERLQGYVVIGAGRTTARITVVAKDDLIDEPNETVIVNLMPVPPNTDPIEGSIYDVDPERRSAEVVILDNDDPRQPTLRIAAVSVFTSEPIPNALVAPGLFRVSRTGPTAGQLQVYLRFSGTATPEADYPKLPDTVTIPAGASEIDFRVEPFSDDLVEGDETVIAGFEPIPAPYLLDPDHQRATVIIRDYEPGIHPTITITAPQHGEFFNSGTDMRIEATAIDPAGYVPIVEFFANETKIGESAIDFDQPPPPGTPIHHEFVWREVPAGNYQLTARGRSAGNALIVSAPVPVHVQDGPAIPFVSITASPTQISEQSPLAFVFPSKVTISRVYGLEYPLRVYLKYEGTATRELDYAPAPTEVVIPAGSSSVEFFLNAKMDSLVEGPETVVIRIAPPLLPLNPDPANHAYEIDSEHRAATITINDMTSPGLPTVSIWKINESTREPRPNEDVAPTVFALRRTGPATNPLRVFLSLAGSANPETDYNSPDNMLQFLAGQSEIRVEIYAKDDDLDESIETIVVSLNASDTAAPPPYHIDPEHRSVTLIIHDNESPQPNLVRIESTDPIATEFPPNADGLDPARFYLSRVNGGDWTRPLQVFLSLHGTAKNGEDYETLPTSFTIPAGLGFVWIDLIPREDNQGVFNKYEIISAPGITWAAARRQAEESTFNGMHGHLATLTTAEEDAHVESLRLEVGAGNAYWVGGYQEQGEPSITENWKWVNNEGPIPGINDGQGYANWLANEPNDYWGPSSENHMVIGWLNTFGWNDQGENVGAQGYVVEYPVVIGVPAEIMESVALRIEPSPAAGMAGYEIDYANRTAIAVIFEHRPPAGGAIEVAFPSPNFTYSSIGDVDFFVAGYHPSVDIVQVDFYVDGQKVGSSNTSAEDEDPEGGFERHRFQWAQATPGRHTLHALATVNGQALSTTQIPFIVANVGANQSPTARITEPHDGASFTEGQPVTFVVEASDSDGTISRIDLITTDQGNQVIASANGPTLRFTVNNLPVGTHTFFARAFDNFEAMGIAPAVRILIRHRDAVAFVHRNLPGSYSPGVAFTVELRANPPAGTHAYAVEDRPPNGWQVANVSHQGAFDSITGKVKFGPFTDANTRILTYRLTPPANASGHHNFAGNSSLNGAAYPIAGDDGIGLVQQFHAADQNQNFSILLGEITAYAAAWKAGDSWAVGSVPIPADYVTSAATIWKRGEAYHFDSTRGAAPACWVPVGEPGLRFQAFDAQPTINADRSISGDLRAGVAARVQITTAPASGTTSYAIEEKPPRGWTISNISHDGTFDADTGAIRWGVFIDGTPRTLTYSITPPAGVVSLGTFAGQFSFDGQHGEISSLNSVTINGGAPIQITNCRRSSAGMHLQVLGPAGQTAVIEASADFVTWTELESIFIPGGAIEFTDESTSTTGHRFYRLRVQ